MFAFSYNKIRPIGLDIGSFGIRMLQLGVSGDVIQVAAGEEVICDPDQPMENGERKEWIIESIRQMLGRGGFNGRNVVDCLGHNDLIIKSLRLETGKEDEIQEAVFSEAKDRFQIDPVEYEVRYLSAGTVRQGDSYKNEILLFATPKEQIEQRLDLLEKAGLTPVAIDVMPCALMRCFLRSLRREEDKNTISVFIDVGFEKTTVLICAGHDITFTKQIPIAGRHINEEVASRLGISINDAIILRAKIRKGSANTVDQDTLQRCKDTIHETMQNLTKEIGLCLRYYAVTFRGERPTEAILTGGEAYEKELVTAMQEQLGMQIRVAQPLKGFDWRKANFDTHLNDYLSEWALVTGLCMKGWDLHIQGWETPVYEVQKT